MKKIIIILFAFFATLSMNAQQSIAGIWNTGQENTKIEIAENDGVFYGKIVSSDNTKANIGNQILKDVKFSEGEGKGKLFAAKKGKWYDAIIEDNDTQLDITIKVGFMSKTITWKEE